MYDHHYDPFLWREPRERLHEGGRLSHLVFVDGRLVDAWSERVEDSTYADVARRHDEDLRPPAVQAPPPLPHHEQALRWLDCVAGSREELLAMTGSPSRCRACATTSTPSRTRRGWSPTSCSATSGRRCCPPTWPHPYASACCWRATGCPSSPSG